MRRLIPVIFISISIMFIAFWPNRAVAEVVIPCDSEPTDQTIDFGNYLDGSNCVISPVGDRDLFRFTASVGDIISIVASDHTFLNGRVICITLLDPSGAPTPNGDISCGEAAAGITETIPQSGTYTIRVSEEGDNFAPEYGLSLERILPPSPTATPLCIGCNLVDSIDGAGDRDLYIFDGLVGDEVQVTASEQISRNGVSICVMLIGPDGLVTPNGSTVCGESAAGISETLQQSGTHVIQVLEQDDNADPPYSVDLQCVVGPSCGSPPMISASPLSQNFGQVVSGSSSTAQTFTVTNGGTGNLIIREVSIHPITSPFGLLIDTCSGQTILSGGQCSLQAVFAPPAVESYSALLRIDSNDPNTPALDVDVTGEGVSTPEGVFGGSVSEATPDVIICRNLNTGASVRLPGPGRTWNCVAAGLVVNPGDEVVMAVRGAAD